MSVEDLEAVAALGWRATDSERLGGWLLRASGGFTGRANSVLPLGDPGLPLDEAIDAAVAWYAARGLPTRFLVPLPAAAAVDVRLGSRGWPVLDVVRVLVADLGPLLLPAPADALAPAVRIDAEPDDAWVAAYHYRGGALPPHAREVIVHGDVLGFASVRAPDGTVLAIARGSVDPAPGGTTWLGLTAVEVDPSARRQGLGGLVLRELAAWAHERGAGACYLQVPAENAPALALYLGAGFAEHHSYLYRMQPAARP